jgi:hypothetical protein
VTTASHPADPADGAQCGALTTIPDDYPGWLAWEGAIAGLLYARRPRSSPPMVVRSTSTEGLRREIESAERERGLRR